MSSSWFSSDDEAAVDTCNHEAAANACKHEAAANTSNQLLLHIMSPLQMTGTVNLR